MRSNRHWVGAGFGFVLLFAALSASAALDADVSVKGQKQGAFVGNSSHNHAAVTVVKFAHEVVSPRDAASGLPTGKRMHKPITITALVDPKGRQQWVTASSTKEILSEFNMTIYRALTPGAAPQVFQTAKLKNAVISKLEIVEPAVDEKLASTPASLKDAVYIRMAIDYEEVQATIVKGGVSASDDWEAPSQ